MLQGGILLLNKRILKEYEDSSGIKYETLAGSSKPLATSCGFGNTKLETFWWIQQSEASHPSQEPPVTNLEDELPNLETVFQTQQQSIIWFITFQIAQYKYNKKGRKSAGSVIL